MYNETSNDTIVAEGASVHLRCEARGFPEPTVSWKRADRTAIVLRNGKGTTRGKITLLLTMFIRLDKLLRIKGSFLSTIYCSIQY